MDAIAARPNPSSNNISASACFVVPTCLAASRWMIASHPGAGINYQADLILGRAVNPSRLTQLLPVPGFPLHLAKASSFLVWFPHKRCSIPFRWRPPHCRAPFQQGALSNIDFPSAEHQNTISNVGGKPLFSEKTDWRNVLRSHKAHDATTATNSQLVQVSWHCGNS